MTTGPGQQSQNRNEFNRSMILGVVVGQVGCLTFIIVLAALFGGLWLDGIFHTKPIITVLAVVASVPITMIIIVWVVRKAAAKLQGMPGAHDQRVGQGGDQQ